MRSQTRRIRLDFSQDVEFQPNLIPTGHVRRNGRASEVIIQSHRGSSVSKCATLHHLSRKKDHAVLVMLRRYDTKMLANASPCSPNALSSYILAQIAKAHLIQPISGNNQISILINSAGSDSKTLDFVSRRDSLYPLIPPSLLHLLLNYSHTNLSRLRPTDHARALPLPTASLLGGMNKTMHSPMIQHPLLRVILSLLVCLWPHIPIQFTMTLTSRTT